MRRILGCVSIALGFALVALAVALPAYVYPRVAKAPINPDVQLVARGDGVKVLLAQAADQGGIRQLPNATVYVTRHITGGTEPNGAHPGKNQNFYEIAFEVDVAGQKNGLLTATVEGGSMNRRTGLANNCCGDFLSTDPSHPRGTPITHEGYQFKLPFDTQKRDYNFWDVNLGKATPAHYTGTEKLHGMTVYRFQQPIPDTVIRYMLVPGSLVGRAPTSPGEGAAVHYADVRTLWIEPNTGALIKGQEAINERLVANGVSVPVLQGTITYDDATVRAQVKEYKGSASQLKIVHKTGPIVGWVLGVILILLGLFLLIRPSRPSRSDRTSRTRWPNRFRRSGRPRAHRAVPDADEDRSAGDQLPSSSTPRTP